MTCFTGNPRAQQNTDRPVPCLFRDTHLPECKTEKEHKQDHPGQSHAHSRLYAVKAFCQWFASLREPWQFETTAVVCVTAWTMTVWNDTSGARHCMNHDSLKRRQSCASLHGPWQFETMPVGARWLHRPWQFETMPVDAVTLIKAEADDVTEGNVPVAHVRQVCFTSETLRRHIWPMTIAMNTRTALMYDARESITLRALLSGTFEGCRKPVLGVWETTCCFYEQQGLQLYVKIVERESILRLLPFFLFKVFSHKKVILDWSYNYHANNMHEQVAPIEICGEKQQTNKNQPTLFAVNKRALHIHWCLYPYWKLV